MPVWLSLYLTLVIPCATYSSSSNPVYGVQSFNTFCHFIFQTRQNFMTSCPSWCQFSMVMGTSILIQTHLIFMQNTWKRNWIGSEDFFSKKVPFLAYIGRCPNFSRLGPVLYLMFLYCITIIYYHYSTSFS